MIKILILIFTLFIGSLNDFVEDVDMIEFNSCYDYREAKNKETKEVFIEKYEIYRQIIFWEWNEEYGRYDVVGFKVISTQDKTGEIHITNNYYILREGEYTKITFFFENPDRMGQKPSFRTKSIKNSRTHISQDPEKLNKRLVENPYEIKLLNFK